MTIKELREILNNTSTNYDDYEIKFYHEKDGFSEKSYNGCFDFFLYRGEIVFAVTTCQTKKDYEWHNEEISWDKVNEYF